MMAKDILKQHYTKELNKKMNELKQHSLILVDWYVNQYSKIWIPKSIMKLFEKFYDIYTNALINACLRNDIKMVSDLLFIVPNEININDTSVDGMTPLCIAVLNRNVNIVELLFKHPNINIDKQDSCGKTALYIASQLDDPCIVQFLLRPRNTVFEYESDIERARLPSFEYSIKNDNSNNMDDYDDMEYQNMELDMEYYDIEGRMLKSINNPIDLSWEMAGCSPVNTTLKGTNPNIANNSGVSPLWIATSKNNIEIMKLLITYGADLNRADGHKGATPLFIACEKGNKCAVDLLLAADADVNLPRSSDGISPLNIAAQNGYVHIVDILLKSGADPFQFSRVGSNPFTSAVINGNVKIIKLIYQHLLNLKSKTEITEFVNANQPINGRTSLHLGCINGHYDAVKYLMYTINVDTSKKDFENKTALEYAIKNGYKNIVSIFPK